MRKDRRDSKLLLILKHHGPLRASSVTTRYIRDWYPSYHPPISTVREWLDGLIDEGLVHKRKSKWTSWVWYDIIEREFEYE